MQTVASYTRDVRNGHRKIPDNLKRERIEYKLSDLTCPCGCGSQLHKIGEVITEQLEIIPTVIFVIQHVRFKYAGCIHQDKVITAPMPNQPIDKGFAGPGLLADVLVKKYDDHLPLYRQSEIFTRSGIKLSINTLCDWVMQSADILAPLVQAMKPDVLSSPKIHTDDTTVPVLKEKGGPTTTGRLWCYLGCSPSCVIYEYSPDRQQKWPIEFLKDYKGYLQADAYTGYDKLFFPNSAMGCRSYLMRNDLQNQMSDEEWMGSIKKDLKDKKIERTANVFRYDNAAKCLYYIHLADGKVVGVKEQLTAKSIDILETVIKELNLANNNMRVKLNSEQANIITSSTKIIEVACMAHARRKFFEIAEANKKSTGSKTGSAVTALNYISRLYKIEAKAKDLDVLAKKALRKREAKPMLKEYKKWLINKSKKVLPKSTLGHAISYTLNNWIALTRYLANGVLSIDNNVAERLMKPVAIGRKNFLFLGNDRGGRAAATIYSLIESCKINKINPHTYLRDILTRLPNTLDRDIRSLLPYIWKPLLDS